MFMFMQCSEDVKYYTLLWSIAFQKQTKNPNQLFCKHPKKPDYSDDDGYSMLQYLLLAERAHLLFSSDDDG